MLRKHQSILTLKQKGSITWEIYWKQSSYVHWMTWSLAKIIINQERKTMWNKIYRQCFGLFLFAVQRSSSAVPRIIMNEPYHHLLIDEIAPGAFPACLSADSCCLKIECGMLTGITLCTSNLNVDSEARRFGFSKLLYRSLGLNCWQTIQFLTSR